MESMLLLLYYNHHYAKVCQHTSVKLWWYLLSVYWSHSRLNSFQLLIASDGNQNASGYLYLDDGESLNTDQSNNYTLLQFELRNVSLGMQAFALLLVWLYDSGVALLVLFNSTRKCTHFQDCEITCIPMMNF